MEPHTTFSPKLAIKTDAISHALSQLARYTIIGLTAVLPLLFVPGVAGMVGLSKVFFAAIALLAVVMIVSFALLRNGAVSLTIPPLIIAWWGLVGVAGVSALLSGAVSSAFVGDAIETQTVASLAILGLMMTVTLLFQNARKATVYLFSGLLLSATILSLWQLLRLVFGVEFLSFGVLPTNTSTLIGNFNDVAIFVSLMTILSLITLIQVRLPRVATGLLAVLVLIALALLVTVNFSMMWGILSLVSLALLMYGLTRDRFGVTADARAPQRISLPVIAIIAVVFVVSTVFLVGGSALGGVVSNMTGISYLEVRPSFGATLDIMRGVYQQNAFTGIGPNQFSDAWRLHKDTDLNQTLFWNTPFSAASGYIPTWFITTGILGVVTWFVFLSVLMYTIVRFLFRSEAIDPFWYFIGSLSSAASLFIWGISFFYVPGFVILLIGALATGMLVVSQLSAVSSPGIRFNFLATTRTGFILIAVVMVVIISSITAGYYILRQFSAVYMFASVPVKVEAAENKIAVASEQLARAYAIHQSDIFAREIVAYQMVAINTLVSLQQPTPVQQQEFQAAIKNALEAANEAVRVRPTNAQNWIALGDVYALLASINIDGARDRAKEAYEKAATYEPANPYFDVQIGLMAYRAEDLDEARSRTESALRLKPNYTDALFLMSQIDIASGDLPKAITSTESLISLEPNNPGRYYQLGVLYAASQNRESSIAAFTAAINLNPEYANARYFRALQLVALNQIDLAITELEAVRDMNPDNTVINTVIDKIKAGERDLNALSLQSTVTEPSAVTTENNVTTSENAPDSNLIAPVNGVGADQTDENDSTEPVDIPTSATTTDPAS